MKKISFLLILLFCSMFFACETEVKNPYLLYEPKLVIRAFLYADEVVQGITISKTIHPLAPSKQLESSFIKDAKVIISTQEMDFKCYYNGSSYCCDELYLQAGETYNLSVKYEDMIATATTIIPDFNIEKVYYTIDSGYYNSFYNFRAKMYAKISSSKPFSFYSWDMQEDMYDMHGTPTMGRYDPKINSSSNILLKFSSANSSSYLFNYFIKNFKDTLFICDETLYSYYMSKSDYDDWSIFGSNGVNPIWNVKGDGIGLFIGCNKKEVKYNN